MADRKKRDRYAGAAYEFGANAAGTTPALGGGAPPPAQYGMPAQGYPGPQAVAVPPQQDPNTLGAQFGQMNLGPQPVPVAPQAQQQAAPSLQNQLYPSDLIAQPVHASEIDQPPPPIKLPSNLAVTPSPHANCPPPYIRSTLACVPTTHSLLKKSKLPFALIVQPYTSLHDDEAPVSIIDDQVISRCRRCRAYINPFVTFLDHGHRWRCNMCNLTNDVPQVRNYPPSLCSARFSRFLGF
jgi:protein transport protein SEC24